MRLLGMYLERHGRPVDFYTDKASLFTINRPLHYNKHLPEKPAKTQIARALEELSIGWIAAHSPQAKGRIERCFGTLQDRLVKALRRARIGALEAANQFLEQVYLPEWNGRFRREPASQADAHRPLRQEHHLASILSHVDTRVVSNDYTISWRGQQYQIALQQARPRLRKSTLRVEQRLTGDLVARSQQQEFLLQPCLPTPSAKQHAKAPARPSPRPRRTVPNHAWMNHFWFGDPAKKKHEVTPPPVALRAPSGPVTS